MYTIIGIIALFVSVIGSYMALGGKLGVLMQPFEVTLILGAGLSSYLIANPFSLVRTSLGNVRDVFRRSRYEQDDLIELLSLQYQVFRTVKMKGALGLEKHVNAAGESNLFSMFPSALSNDKEFELLLDYLRLIIMGCDNPYEIEALFEQELALEFQEGQTIVHSLTMLAESFPALGIIAAVLGVIKAMGAVSEPPEVLGGLIGAALVGTFLGIFFSYGVFSPFANAIKLRKEEEQSYLNCMKVGVVSHLRGYAPAISVEFARKAISERLRPDFYELEEALAELPPVK